MPSLRAFDAKRFMAEQWQQQPLLIRAAWAEWSNPLEPDELAGLACEAEVESRLVRLPAPGRWELEHGPFDPERFAELQDCPWTLLVQAVDHHIPVVAELIEPFRFIPNWRIDDVMVSYASDGGGVGPHFDRYDVFLVQGLGRRRWRVGRRCDESAPLLPHDGLRLLADFDVTEDWVLEPGDILYVPPGFAHDGVAVGDDCMTYSIGFRAPSRGDLVSGWADHVLDTLAEDDRYTDQGADPAGNPGEISAPMLARLHGMAMDALADPAAFASWFGRHVTAQKDDRFDWSPGHATSADALLERSEDPLYFHRNPASRFSFVRQEAGAIMLFVDGIEWALSGPAARIAERLSASSRFIVERADLSDHDVSALIVELINRGSIASTVAD